MHTQLVIKRLQVIIQEAVAGEFSFPKLPFCADLIKCPFHQHVPAVVHKRSWSCCQKCRWQIHLNMHTPCPKSKPSRHSVGTYWENKFTCNSSGNTWPQLSPLADPLWTDPGLNSRILSELISLKKKKKRGGGNRSANWDWFIKNHLPKFLYVRKKSPSSILHKVATSWNLMQPTTSHETSTPIFQ